MPITEEFEKHLMKFWVHNASNADYTFLSIHEKRGWIGMNEVGLLPFYHGIIVHDRRGSYW